MVKLFSFLKRHADTSPAEFHRHWREHHGPLFLSTAPARRYAIRYEQNHAIPETTDQNADDYDGVAYHVVPLRRRHAGHVRRPRLRARTRRRRTVARLKPHEDGRHLHRGVTRTR